MPANLRPNNVNPFGDLDKLLSIGLHDRTDDECCEIVGVMDDSLKFIYTQLTTHMEASKAYEAGTGKVAALLAKMRKHTVPAKGRMSESTRSGESAVVAAQILCPRHHERRAASTPVGSRLTRKFSERNRS